jgi:hypothetical protein
MTQKIFFTLKFSFMKENNKKYTPNFLSLNQRKGVGWVLNLAKNLVLVLLFTINSNKLLSQVFPSFVPNPTASTCTGDNTATLCYDLVGTGSNGDGIINSVNIILDDAGSMSPNLVIASWGDDDLGDALGGVYNVTISPAGNSVLNYADMTGRPEGSVIGTVCFTTTSVDGSGDGFTINVNSQDAAFFPAQIDGVNITAENDLVIVGSGNSTTPCAVTDTDGDGINDDVDANPMDPCLPAQTAGSTSYDASNAIWAAADCDGDGIDNGTEATDGTDPYTNNTLVVQDLPALGWVQKLLLSILLLGIVMVFATRLNT